MEVKNNAVYVLSADPMHYGHVHNLEFARDYGFEKVYVGIGMNPAKKYLFNRDERVMLAKKTLEASGFDLEKFVVEPFRGLARNYAARKGARIIIRGSRNPADFSYEKELSDYHDRFGLTTLIVPAKKETQGMSSSMAKAIAMEAGMTHAYVHPLVKQALEEKLRGYSLIGVTGNMGSGKSRFCKELVEYAKTRGQEINHIDFDKLIQSLYFREDGLGERVRTDVKKCFGENLFEKDKLNTKKLAGLVFGDSESRSKLAEILKQPAVMALEEKLLDTKGIVLVDAAYFTEYNMLPLVNNNVLFVNCTEKTRYERILKRDGLTKEELESRVKAQHTPEEKIKIIKQAQEKSKSGFYLEVDSDKEINLQEVFERVSTYFPLFKNKQ
jgi:pantetheine-phosphate adenylyltransferase